MAGSLALPWLRPFLILSLVLSVPPLLYWFGHVERRMDEAQRQDFTTLAAITTQLRERLDAYRQIAENADRSCDPVRYLKSILPNSPRARDPLTADRTALRLQLGGDGALDLHVFDNPGCNGHSGDIRHIVSVNLDSLIAWSLVESSFEGLLVFDQATGKLVAQDRRLPAQPLGMPLTLHSADKSGDKPIDLASFLKSSNGGTDTQPFNTGRDTYIRIAGVDYLPFMQVLNVPVAANKNTTTAGSPAGTATEPTANNIALVVCALLQKNALQREAIALSPGQLVYVLSFVALGVLAIPFLKLRFIGQHERMRPSDVWLLGGAMLAGTALVLLVVLQFCSTRLLRERFDQSLQHFAATVQAHVRLEAKAAVAQLISSAPQLLALPVSDHGDGAILTQREFTYPSFDNLFTANLAGKQQRKWTPRSIATPMIPVNDKDYFSSALALDYASGYAGGSTLNVAFEALVSPTTGLQLGVFALPTSAQQTAGASQPMQFKPDGIVALTTQLYSINQPLVPEPFQFVVLDKHGQVVFQAAQEPYWHERFFESIRNGYALERAARLYDGNNASSAISYYSYHEKMYRMLARPLPELDATLVVYYEKSVYESMVTRVFSSTALFALGLIGCVLLSVCVTRRLFGTNALDWAWPSEAHVDQYAFGIVISLAAGVSYVLAWWLLPPHIVMWFFLLAPGLAIIGLTAGLSGAVARLISKRPWTRWHAFTPQLKRYYPTLYVVFGVVTLLSCIGTPLVLVFDDVLAANAAAFEHSTARKLRAAQYQQEQFPSLKIVKTAAFPGSPRCDNPQQTAEDLRCVAPERVYAVEPNYRTLREQISSFGRYDACADIDGLGHCKYNDRIDALTPNDAGFGLRFMPATLAGSLARFATDGADLSWSFARVADGKLTVARAPFVIDGQLLCAWFWPGLFLTAVGLSLVVRSVSTHVFGLELIGDGVLVNESERQTARRVLLLRPPQRVIDTLRANTAPTSPHQCVSLDLQTLSCAPGEFAQTYQARTTVVVLQVEQRLADREWRDALLQLVNCSAVTKLTLASAVDPFHFIAQRLQEATLALLAPETKDATESRARCSELQAELSKWAVAFSGVEKIRYGVASHWINSAALPASQLDAELLTKLENECRWSDQLIEIGMRLLARSDLAQYRWTQIVAFIEDAAEPYYRSLWDLCSRDEKLAMIQLAQEGFVNPRNVELVRRLARRRLVIVDPRFRLINESFREFVRKLEPAERVTAWERSGAVTAWSRISTPLYALAAMVIAILLYTEQSFLTDTLAVATVASGTLGSLRNLYTVAKQAVGAAKVV
jgi:hypothetical protein